MTETTNFIESWSTEQQLNDLTRAHRYDEYMNGVIRSIIAKPVRILDEISGSYKLQKKEFFMVALRNGSIGYCPTELFATREYQNYRRFVGINVNFAIESIDLDARILVLNAKVAQEKSIALFWETLEELKESNTLKEHRFLATVRGKNEDTRRIYVTIEGQSCFMDYSQWSYNPRDTVDVSNGDEIEVMVQRFDKERQLVSVTRKKTLSDPYKFLEGLKKNDIVAGKVASVHPIHGIYVQVENGLDVKAGKMKQLEEPCVGDVVTCRVQVPIRRRIKDGRPTDSVQGRIAIIGYPKGKRVKKDLGSFLFD